MIQMPLLRAGTVAEAIQEFTVRVRFSLPTGRECQYR